MATIYDAQLFNAFQLVGFGTSINTLTLNSTTAAGAVHFVSNGKQITKIRVSIASVTTPPVFQVSLQSISGAVPTGTILGGASPASATFTPVAGINDVTLSNAYTPTLGDHICAVIAYSSGTIGASNNATLNLRGTNFGYDIPGAMQNTGGGWGSVAFFPMMSVIFSDATVLDLTYPMAAAPVQTNYNTGTSPNEYGIKFVAPAGMTINALFTAGVQNNGSADGQTRLYDSGGSSLTGTDNLKLLAATFTLIGNLNYQPITPVTLTSGSTYYLTWQPTTLNNVSLYKYTFPDAATRQIAFGDAWFVSRTGTGAWTEDTASAVALTPIIQSSSAGGGTSGGFVFGA